MLIPLAALSILAATAAPPAPAASQAGDRAAIEAVLDGESDAWDRGDAEAFAAATTPDVVFTNIVGMFSVGRVPFVAQHARIFSTIYKGSTMTHRLAHIAFVRPDVAVVDTANEVRNFRELPPGMTAVDGALRTRLEQVMVREGGAWRVAAFHNVTVGPGTAAAAAAPPPH